jgi:tetratricopeptide (TPR) repeat protein
MSAAIVYDDAHWIQRAKSLKLQGNEYSETQKFGQAFQKYNEALDILKQKQLAPEEQALIYSNISMVYFVWKEYDNAVEAAENGLKCDPSCASCILRMFNALWKKESCILAIMIIHEFLNDYPEKMNDLLPILNNIENSKNWYLHPSLRIVKLNESNYCIKAMHDIEQNTVLVKDSIIFPLSISSNDRIPFVFKHLIEHFDLYKNRFMGLYPRKKTDVPREYFAMWYELVENMTPDYIGKEREILEEFTRLLLVIKLNGFAGVYAIACLFNHSCNENAEKIDNEIISIRDIKKGDFVNLNYIGYNDGVLNRRNILRTQFSFTCECYKCIKELQPTSQADGFKCASNFVKNCQGIIYCPLLTEEEMSVSEDATVQCSNYDHCKYEIHIDSLLSQYRRYKLMIEKASMLDKCNLDEVIKALSELLSDECILMPQHHLYQSMLPIFYETVKINIEKERDSANKFSDKSSRELLPLLVQYKALYYLQQYYDMQLERYGQKHEETVKINNIIQDIKALYSLYQVSL